MKTIVRISGSSGHGEIYPAVDGWHRLIVRDGANVMETVSLSEKIAAQVAASWLRMWGGRFKAVIAGPGVEVSGDGATVPEAVRSLAAEIERPPEE